MGCRSTAAVETMHRPSDSPVDRMVSGHLAQDLFAKVFACSHDMILVLDPLAGRIVDANPMACRTLEYERDELLALDPARLHPGAASRFAAFASSVVDEGSGWTDEFECVTRTGRRVPTEIAASRIVLDGRSCLLLLARDVTARRRAEREMRRLSRRVVEAQEAERRRVARELHDGVNQLLSSARLQLQSVRGGGSAGTSPGGDGERIERADRLVRQAMDEVRRISSNLRPSELDDLGLVSALRRLAGTVRDRVGTEVAIEADDRSDRLGPDIELALYRIAQEALANVAQHAGAARATVALDLSQTEAVLTVSDDGRGIAGERPAGARGGLGLLGMRERAAALGGSVRVAPRPAGGTEVSVRIPLPEAT